MKKISVLFLFVLLTAQSPLLGAGTANVSYSNAKYDFSFSYPSTWRLGFFGESRDTASVVWAVSDAGDVEPSDGGLPRGAKVEIMANDLKELKDMDPRFPDIKSAKDWLDWERSGGSKAVKGGGKAHKDEKVVVAGYEAIRSAKKNKILIVLLRSNTVYRIQYLGSKTAYLKNIGTFEDIVKSITFPTK